MFLVVARLMFDDVPLHLFDSQASAEEYIQRGFAFAAVDRVRETLGFPSADTDEPHFSVVEFVDGAPVDCVLVPFEVALD